MTNKPHGQQDTPKTERMTEMDRREFLTTTAAVGGVLFSVMVS